MPGGNAHQRAVERARKQLKEKPEIEKPFPQTSVLYNPRESDKSKKPDLGTRIGFVGTAMAIILFLEEKSTWSVVILLIGLFFVLLPLVFWCLTDLIKKVTKNRVWTVAVLVTIVAVGIYGWHALPDTSYSPVRLRQMSGKDLKEVEKRLSDQMREFQLERDREVVKYAQTDIGSHEYQKSESEFRAKFFNQFLPKMVAVRSEVLWRLGKPPEQSEKEIQPKLPSPWDTVGPVTALLPFSGTLSGPSPLALAATYLDLIAGLVPDQ